MAHNKYADGVLVMASVENPCPEHHQPTQRSNFHYCFSVAHHGRGFSDDSQWSEDLSQDEEFAIFDESDLHHLSDSGGHYYGLRRSSDGTLLSLGTQGEQIAKFWNPVKNRPTHGFPLWPLAVGGPENRRRIVAPREALLQMEQAGLLQPTQRKRLQKGARS